MDTGTFRDARGNLVHIRADHDGELSVATEDGGRLGVDDELVKLSDDPTWPDFDSACALGAECFE